MVYSQTHFYIEIMKISVPPQAGCWPLPGHPYQNIMGPPLTAGLKAHLKKECALHIIAGKKNIYVVLNINGATYFV